MAIYSDLNLSCVKHPNTRDILKRYDLDAVRNAVKNFIRTNHGEKLFMPNYGGNLRALLFEPAHSSTSELLKRRWNEQLKMYEPRANIKTLDVTYENAEMHIVLEVELVERPELTFILPISVDRIR